MTETIRVRIWTGRYDDYPTEPDELVECEVQTPTVWKEDPHFHSPPLGIDIHPDDRPATLKVYTSDSVHSPPGYDSHVETGYWDGPMEAGLPFNEESNTPPFGCEVWGRVMFFAEEGLTR